MRAILPQGVAVAEAFDDPPEAVLFPGEADAITRSVDKRRREYATVRHCARLALAELGLPPAAILNGEHREPLWPPGLLGSLTHCDGYRAAALARAGSIASLGIDAEPHLPLPDGVLDTIARREEHPHLTQCAARAPGIHWDRLLFSAKESVYKAWFPLARCWLGFEDATLRFDPTDRTFTARLHKEGPTWVDGRLTTMHGQWQIQDGLVQTSVVVPSQRLERTNGLIALK